MSDELQEVRTYADQAAKWVSSLDRSRLGRFSFPDDALAAAWGLEHLNAVRATIQVPNEEKEEWDDLDDNFAYALIAAVNGEQDEMFYETYNLVMGELVFWGGGVVAIMSDEVSRLRLVHDNPESFHDYYAVGIWDTEAIERFIADDIDAQLALVVSR